MQDFRQRVIRLYSTREQLIQQGVWEGGLYRAGDGDSASIEVCAADRAWVWRSLLLNPEDDDAGEAGTGSPRYISQDAILSGAVGSLVPVPMLSSGSSESAAASATVHNSVSPVRRLVNGVRKLTPKETVVHPLDSVESVPAPDDTGMSLADTLEIVDLDLSRLMLADIFQQPAVHALMRKIMYNYLLLDSRRGGAGTAVNSAQDSSPLFHYRQGYHEVLGVVYLQFAADDGDIPPESVRFVLYIFAKLMQPLAAHFYVEKNLLYWETHTFSRMLKLAAPDLHAAFYPRNSQAETHPHNLIWLIRWTRLLFLRELSLKETLVVWDHALTFAYPLEVFVAAVIVAVLVSRRRDIAAMLRDADADTDDLIEYMLQFGRAGKPIGVLQVCALARKLCDAWECGQYRELRGCCEAFAREHDVDPNRKRLEDRLRRGVRRSLAQGHV